MSAELPGVAVNRSCVRGMENAKEIKSGEMAGGRSAKTPR